MNKLLKIAITLCIITGLFVLCNTFTGQETLRPYRKSPKIQVVDPATVQRDTTDGATIKDVVVVQPVVFDIGAYDGGSNR